VQLKIQNSKFKIVVVLLERIENIRFYYGSAVTEILNFEF